MEYILNPVYFIYYFVLGNDFLYQGKRNYTYFILNLIISLIISFCGCVYNEFIILFCCGLERDTHNQVALRSDFEKDIGPLNIDEDSEINEDEQEKGGLFELISLNPISK